MIDAVSIIGIAQVGAAKFKDWLLATRVEHRALRFDAFAFMLTEKGLIDARV